MLTGGEQTPRLGYSKERSENVKPPDDIMTLTWRHDFRRIDEDEILQR